MSSDKRVALTREQIERFLRKYFNRMSPEDEPRIRTICDLAISALRSDHALERAEAQLKGSDAKLKAARQEALEEAAKVCEDQINKLRLYMAPGPKYKYAVGGYEQGVMYARITQCSTLHTAILALAAQKGAK